MIFIGSRDVMVANDVITTVQDKINKEFVTDPDYFGLPYSTGRCIELSEYPEYGPADSDSSVADSTDSEPDSGDDEFVEDDGPFVPGLTNLLAGNYDPFENMALAVPDTVDISADA
ncbi:MAG: hypothetical protein L6R40_000950 [Gallowayella cf. fulva]|nr:MAG: hypothetical protein L6R40_000950 [Xanthomendoza cf. fulva]